MTAGLVVLAAMTGGCAADDGEGGFGLPTLTSEEAADVLVEAGAAASVLAGDLSVADDGCFLWSGADASGAWIVWPADASHEGDAVALGDGRVIHDGDRLTGEGALIALDDLPDGASADSYFGSFGRFCGADEGGVLLVTSVGP